MSPTARFREVVEDITIEVRDTRLRLELVTPYEWELPGTVRIVVGLLVPGVECDRVGVLILYSAAVEEPGEAATATRKNNAELIVTRSWVLIRILLFGYSDDLDPNPLGILLVS